MNTTIRYLLASLFGALAMHNVALAQKPEHAASVTSLYEYSFTAIDGKRVELSEFRGKYMLIVNVASECGYTPQYKDLEELHRRLGDKVVVIGFPSNEFGAQEPGTDEEIAAFCESTYGVTFLLARKTMVLGDDRHPVYRWLADKTLNGWNEQAPKWNFFKYLIDRKGELLGVFPSKTGPLSKDITGRITE